MKAGVNIFGYVLAESGVGEHTRLLVETVKRAGIDYSVIPFTSTSSRQRASFEDFGSGRPDFDTNIIGVNADQMQVFIEHFGSKTLARRYNIALWAWELEEFPDWMARSGRLVDEIWANSSFSAEAIAGKVDRPVYPFPLPIRTPRPPIRSRFELGLPEGFLFAFFFDFDSVLERKNPMAVVRAFCTAFEEGSGACLLIKSINGDRHGNKVRRLQREISDRSDIIFRDGLLLAEDNYAMMASCDVYVSLHRAEGFGLTLAEAMALEKPVIATDYSGNRDFMNDANSYLVPADLVPVGPDNQPYPADAMWADPDEATAAELMREVMRSQSAVRAKTKVARQEIENLHSPSIRSRFVVDRLEEIRGRRTARST